MAAESAIEWCDSTFNPWIGCAKVSPACDDCYAARSTPARTLGVAWGTGEPRRRTSASNWAKPLLWEREHEAFALMYGRRRRVFCASLADLFDNEVDPQWRADLFALIASTPNLTWLLLTKRIGNVLRLAAEVGVVSLPANVWMGATVVDQAEADRDIPKLLAVPARVRFLSIEPMLGPINLTAIPVGGGHGHHEFDPVVTGNVLKRAGSDAPHVHWVICGGESGPGARPMHPDWARSLRDQCAAAGVPFLFKQWGEWVPADDNIDGVVPVTEIVGDVGWQEGKRVRVQWLSPNDSIVGHSFARLGKKVAGRVLDGRTHDQFPAKMETNQWTS